MRLEKRHSGFFSQNENYFLNAGDTEINAYLSQRKGGRNRGTKPPTIPEPSRLGEAANLWGPLRCIAVAPPPSSKKGTHVGDAFGNIAGRKQQEGLTKDGRGVSARFCN